MLFKICIPLTTNEFSVKSLGLKVVPCILICHGVSREIVLGHFARILRLGVCAIVTSEASIVMACLL